MPGEVTIVTNLSAAVRNRRRMATRLGFDTVRELESWEEEIVLDHFANFICDYLAMGYTVEPDKRELVEFIDLHESVEERIKMLEERRFESVLDPDKSECKSSFILLFFFFGGVLVMSGKLTEMPLQGLPRTITSSL